MSGFGNITQTKRKCHKISRDDYSCCYKRCLGENLVLKKNLCYIKCYQPFKKLKWKTLNV